MKKERTNCLWLSFADSETGKNLGVIITHAKEMNEALSKINKLGINPGGEIQGTSIFPEYIKPEHFDILLSKKALVEAGYVTGK